jgi:two-component system OmpR family response regulator
MAQITPIKVFIVEDDMSIANQIKATLNHAEFDCNIALCATSFLDRLSIVDPDLCIIDLGLPDFDGIDLVSEVKARSRASVLILSGRNNIRDKVSGLETGADDYMVKPYDQAELVARVKSILRRKPENVLRANSKDQARFLGWRFNLANNTLISVTGEKVPLTAAEAEMLKVLVKNPRRVLPRERLVGQRDLSAYDRSVDIRISRLRKKLETALDQQEIIKTVYGAGYIFVADVDWDKHD